MIFFKKGYKEEDYRRIREGLEKDIDKDGIYSRISEAGMWLFGLTGFAIPLIDLNYSWLFTMLALIGVWVSFKKWKHFRIMNAILRFTLHQLEEDKQKNEL